MKRGRAQIDRTASAESQAPGGTGKAAGLLERTAVEADARADAASSGRRATRVATGAEHGTGGSRVFLISPASCAGKRAQMLLRDAAAFPLARQVREAGAPLGEVFTFLSGLYFRGKLAYATAFASPPPGAPPTLIITSSRGLVAPSETTTLPDLEEYARVPIDSIDFRDALDESARALERAIAPDTLVILLGSIATGKYVDVLLDVFGARLRFPVEFVGRGDMSRGGLLLRCAEDRRALEYVPIDGRSRRGRRPPRLEPRRAVAARAPAGAK